MSSSSAIALGGRAIGPGHPCFVVAEAGLNHNGDLEIAKRLIAVAASAGADAVKFQKRTVARLAIESVLDAPDDRFPAFGKTYREIREHLEFGRDAYVELIHHCKSHGILFLCTAFDTDASAFLDELGVQAFKLASHSLTNLPLIEDIARRGKPVILSTGMCTFDEIDDAVGVLRGHGAPFALMHCVSSYPQKPEESNLRLIGRLAERYRVPVGYSGHELGFLPTLAGVALGASLVERHITLDRSLVGFDHKLSLEPAELAELVRAIRVVEQSLGSGEKAVSDTELVTRRKYHVSVVSAVDIPPGAVVTPDFLTLKNPGTGLPARRLGELLGRRARTFIPADTLVDAEMFEP